MDKYLIDRCMSIRWLSTIEMNNLSFIDRKNILYDFFCYISENHEEFYVLTDELKNEVKRNDILDDNYESLIKNSNDLKYNFVILENLIEKHKNVSNEYIEERLKYFGIKNIKIKDNNLNIYKCPCCSYLTLNRKNEYDICKVCFWEDDGSENIENMYSGVNKLYINEAKENFKLFGACSKKFLEFLDPQRFEKYSKG